MNFSWNMQPPTAQPTPQPTAPAQETIILAHGFGANEYDLGPLCFEMDVSAGGRDASAIQWLFPQAPIQLQAGSYAWFPSDRQELALGGRYFQNIAEISLPEVGQRARELVDDAQELGVVWENCFIGGFSQGSMIALRAVLEQQLPVRGLILFSTSLIDRQRSRELIESCPPGLIFQSHGSHDQMLQIGGAEELREMLLNRGWTVDYCEFPDGHTIPAEVIRKAGQFISDHRR